MSTTVSITSPTGEKVDITPALLAQEFNTKELQTAQTLIAELLDSNWHGILTTIARSEDGTGSVSISLKLDHSGANRDLHAKLSFSQKTSDEAECSVKNPAQEEFSL